MQIQSQIKIFGVSKPYDGEGYKDREELRHIMWADRLANIPEQLCEGKFDQPENTALDFARLLTSFDTLKPKKALSSTEFSLKKGVSKMSLREAMLAPQEIIPIKKAIGRICAAPTVSCPPAIPIVISGEEITKEAIEIFRFYGVENIAVVK